MKMIVRLCAYILLFMGLLLGIEVQANAQEKTATGFYYPIGVSSWDHGYGAWLERDAAHGGHYDDGYYHIGEDMLVAKEGASVYAISKGTVVKIYTSTAAGDPWYLYTGNSVMFVQHKLNDGTSFLAAYMHVHPTKKENDPVKAGEVIATVGPWYNAVHLHFGIHPDIKWPTTSWGRMKNADWPGTNKFVDPVDWIRTRTPDGDGNSSSDFYVDANGGNDGNNGTSDSPLKTLSKALGFSSVERIFLRAGTYNEPGVARPIRIKKKVRILKWDGSGSARIAPTG